MSVGENIAFPLMVRRLPRAEIATKVARALSMVRLEGLADRRTQQLSGGQQQRVAVARALVFEPSLVLLDEPLGALDRQLREQMQYELKHLHQRLGVTMVYVTHDQVEAMTMSDRVAVFSTGTPAPGRRAAPALRGARFAVRRPVPGREQRAGRHGRAPRRRAVQRRRCQAVRRSSPRRSAPASPAARSISCCGRRRWRWARRHAAAPIASRRVSSRRRSWATSCACGWRRWAARTSCVKLPNAPGQGALEPGTPVEIGWRTEDCRALVA